MTTGDPTTDVDGTVPFEQDAFDPDIWERVGRELLAKMLAEFAYEDLVAPEPPSAAEGAGVDADADAWDRYEVALDGATYRFVARERLCDSYLVGPYSIERRGDDGGWREATDPVQFIRDAQGTFGVDGLTAGHLFREYKHTLLADAHIRARERRRGTADATELSYAEIEGEMTGHPWITYNKGRIGWGYDDYRRFAPETGTDVRLSWLAADRTRATFASVDGIQHDPFVSAELGDSYEQFRDTLARRGLDPDDYYFLPVHEWQWEHSIAPLYPGAIARDEIVPLGDGPDCYRPMQSVRTFVNADDPEKHNVKVPMRILNTLVWRGLPGDRTEVAPLVTEYVQGIRDEDPFLREECELVLPGEVASVDVEHPDFAKVDGTPYQYDELLGCVWRESVEALVREAERPITLAALMHVSDGEPFVSQLVAQSGLSLEAWLDELFAVVLPPLLHYLYRYGTAFSPHGQNAILVVEDGVPTRLAVKDFVDDVNVSAFPLPELEALPADLRAVLRTEPPEGLCQFIFCGLFVCVFRYVSNVLTEHHEYPEERFWSQVRDAVRSYQSRFPDLEERFELFDLLRPTFPKLCLNRNRLLEYGYADADGRPHAAEHGAVRNPLYEVSGR